MTAGTNEQSRYTGRHARPRRKTTRKRVGRVVPAVAVAATVAAGTAAYAMAAGGSHPGQLSDALTSPASSARTAGAGAGWANSAAAAGLKTAAPAATASVSHTAAATPRATATKTAAPAPSPTATAAAAAASTPAASATSAPATSAPATSAPATALSCDLGYSMLPQNVTAIVSFLLAHGYSDNAAAGIAGNIYQESKGDPESVGSGGGGLIGFTPLPSGYVTGDAAADLQTQLAAILTYNEGWASYLPELNSAASPSDAAYIYVTDFERAGIPAAATRESSAADVASACGI